MPVFMDSSSMQHPCHAKQSLDRLSKIGYKDADGKGCSNMSAVSTMETMPTFSDRPRLSDCPATNNLDNGYNWDDKDHAVDDTDDEMDKFMPEHFLAPERSSDEGRLCDISYTDFHDDLLKESFNSGLSDPLFSELHPEPMVPNKFSFFRGMHQNAEVGSVQKPIWKVSEGKGNTVSFCNRLLKITKAKQDGEEDFEVGLLARFSILTQIAQHADQAQDLFTAPADDLKSANGFGRQMIAPLLSHCTSPASKHSPVDLSVLDEAVEMDRGAESPEHAPWKVAYDIDHARDSFMPVSKDFGRQVSVGPRCRCKVPAPADALNFDSVFCRQVIAPLSLHSRSVTLKHELADLAMNAFAGLPGRALEKMALHADQAQYPFMPDSKDCARQISAGSYFGLLARGFGHQGTAPVPSHARSLNLKHEPADPAVLEKAVEMDAFAGLPGRALWKMGRHADQAQDPFMPDSKDCARQVSVGPYFGHFAHGFCRQGTAPLPLHARSLNLKHKPADLVALGEAVEMDAFAGHPGRALRKRGRHADQAQDPFISDSKHCTWEVSTRPAFGRQISAPDNDFEFAHGCFRQVTAALKSTVT